MFHWNKLIFLLLLLPSLAFSQTVTNKPPVGNEPGTVTRNIPGGVQSVAPFPSITPVPNKLPQYLQPQRIVGALGNPVAVDGDRLRVAPTPSNDPCVNSKKTDAPISQTTSTQIVAGIPGLSIYICAIRIVAGAAEIVSLWEGTGAACGTGTIVHSGSATVANGESLAANGGFQSGNGGASVVTLGPGTNFCVAQSSSSRVSGGLSYVYAP